MTKNEDHDNATEESRHGVVSAMLTGDGVVEVCVSETLLYDRDVPVALLQ